MGRRPGGTTKSGRFMNPADQERKSMRQKELKRNKRQRIMVRQAILKSKDIDEIIENLSRLDDQELDIHVEHHSKYVFNEKRAKYKQTYSEVMNLYRQEKRDDKIKELEQKMERYEAERSRKVQQYNALRFSLETNPMEIPLPDGTSAPNAAMTPSATSIPSQYLMPQARAGILKNSRNVVREGPERTDPPGPPCGIPPSFFDEDVDDNDDVDENLIGRRRVRFSDNFAKVVESDDIADDDYGPVEIPPEVMQQDNTESERTRTAPVLAPQISTQSLIRAPPIPPNMLPPPPRLPLRMPPPPPHFARPGIPPIFMRPPAGDSVISAEPVVRRPVDQPTTTSVSKNNGEATISAEPKLRDLTKELTKLVPTSLRVNRNKIQPKRFPNKYNMMGVQVESAQRKEAKDTDQAYADFMKEISSLL